MSRPEPHYVYRLLGKRGRVLYIGCSMNVDGRMVDHRRNLRLGRLIAKVETFGPYNFDEARRIEREWIGIEQPPHNTEHTKRERRGKAWHMGGLSA